MNVFPDISNGWQRTANEPRDPCVGLSTQKYISAPWRAVHVAEYQIVAKPFGVRPCRQVGRHLCFLYGGPNFPGWHTEDRPYQGDGGIFCYVVSLFPALLNTYYASRFASASYLSTCAPCGLTFMYSYRISFLACSSLLKLHRFLWSYTSVILNTFDNTETRTSQNETHDSWEDTAECVSHE